MWPILTSDNARAFDVDTERRSRSSIRGWGFSVVSAVTGVVMLLIFGKTSNQKKIAETKDKLKAYIMEMWIFRNDTRVMFAAIGSVLGSNLQYLRHSLRPLVFLIIPVLVIMVQLGIRYADEPLMPGDRTVVSVKLREGVVPTATPLEFRAPKGVRVVSPALRIDSKSEIDWEISGGASGAVPAGGRDTQRHGAQAAGRRPSQEAGQGGRRQAAGQHVERVPVPSGAARSVQLRHRVDPRHVSPPRAQVPRAHGQLALAFFIISVAAGFALKGVFGIEV